ncbi:mechanosensitive ion channel domain-containing protein [Sodalis ligni]|uniref:Small-conductance mechanosensitive channel n=1 Tax=Sodalis ligni TaxID=2697027 RepID=A0A4R1NEJ5_9GAMM|nr:mechanosensitive ion channel family protein [Sodalis ligni]TCL05892.1 small-conductance mechanosensitive channel [Sodalis ligni]
MGLVGFSFPLLCALLLLAIDLTLWQWIANKWFRWKVLIRLGLYFLFSLALMNAGLSPLSPIPAAIPSSYHALVIILAIAWWLLGARTLTVLMILILAPRIGGKGHLLQDVLGAFIFLMAALAASTYVLDLPLKGLLATSGAVAIILGLAVQSTLSDVFSGIVLNATKPFRVDDWIRVDDIDGKVIEIDWRSTHLLTPEGSMAVIPNAMAAKTRIVNFSRPDHFHSVTLSVELPVRLRPSLALDALEKALQGCRELLLQPQSGALVKKAYVRYVEYEVTGYVKSRDRLDAVRNQLYDLIYRQLSVMESLDRGNPVRPLTRQSAVLNTVSALRMLSDDDRAELGEKMRLTLFSAGEVILEQGVVPEELLIIESGVVSVTTGSQDNELEVGRMGPGEVMGETGIVDHSACVARFSAMTDCVVYRISYGDLEPWLEEHGELREVMVRLAHFRAQKRDSVVQQQPPAPRKKGFMHWLRQMQRNPRE